jgi:hypothetical protein
LVSFDAVIAMPRVAPPSGSVTPPVYADTRDPTAPTGAPASSATVSVRTVSARTGASFTGVTSIRAIAVLEAPAPSDAVTVTVRCVVDGLLVVFSNWTCSMASAYCAFVNEPVSVTRVSVRVQPMPLPSVPLPADEPLTRNRSPVC